MTHHRRGLRRLLQDDPLLTRIETDYRTAGLDARKHAILDYAVKLTERPAAMTRDDVDALRRQGLSDLDVLEIAEVVGYYAYVNRMADGLGVTLEAE